MGYYTRYTLTSEPHVPMAELLAATDNDQELAFMLSLASNKDGDTVKWYKHDDEMRFISKQFPTVLFTLHGSGEDNADLWTKYYKNGSAQTARANITYDVFDERKLV